MKTMMKKGMIGLLLATISLPLFAQKIAVKTNLIYDITTTFNLGVEYRLAPRWTVDVSGNYNPFTFSDNKKWKHWLVQPEARYWFSEAFDRHFVGAHLLGGVFNSSNINAPSFLSIFPTDKGYRYEGEMFGAGLTYGYHHVLSSRWSLEYAIGLGWVHSDYDKYECTHCGDLLKSSSKDFLGVTKAAISLVYTINRPKKQKPVVTDTYLPVEAPVVEKVEEDTLVQEEQPVVEPVQEEPREVIRFEVFSGDLLFAWDSHQVNPSLYDNAASLDSVLTSLKKVVADSRITIEGIEVVGYASPEGRAGYNQQLSERRAQAFVEYLASQVPGLDPQILRAEGHGEDWNGFVRLLTDQPLDVAGIDALLQQAKEHPERIDNIEYQIRRKAGNVLKQKYYPQLRRIEINVRMKISDF